MGDATEIQTSTASKITGGDENLYLDVKLECGQNRAQVSSVERATETMRCAAVTVGTSAVVVRAGATALTNRLSIQIQNVGHLPIVLGTSNVTVNTGIILYPKSSVVYDAKESIEFYAIASVSGQELRVMELS